MDKMFKMKMYFKDPENRPKSVILRPKKKTSGPRMEKIWLKSITFPYNRINYLKNDLKCTNSQNELLNCTMNLKMVIGCFFAVLHENKNSIFKLFVKKEHE